MFDAPTIAELAVAIAARLGAEQDDGIALRSAPDLDTVQMHPEVVDELSEEQVDALLQQIADSGDDLR